MKQNIDDIKNGSIVRSEQLFGNTGYAILPWVGKNYQNQMSRVALVFDSHYIEDAVLRNNMEKIRSYSIDIVTDYLQNGRKKGTAFYSKLGKLMSMSLFGAAGTGDIYDSIVYHNFITSPLPKFGVDPTKEQIDESVAPFKRFVASAKPDILIMFGGRAKKYLEASGIEFPQSSGPRVVVTGHPMGSFSYARAVEDLQKQLTGH